VTISGYFSIALGGALGALLRHVVTTLAQSQLGDPFPWGTLTVNVIGSFLIGVLFQVFDEMTISTDVKLLLATGGLGAFTTFSTYSLETFRLIEGGKIELGLLNLAVSTVVGLTAVFLGIYLVRFLSGLGSS
jgi:CrcB protein